MTQTYTFYPAWEKLLREALAKVLLEPGKWSAHKLANVIHSRQVNGGGKPFTTSSLRRYIAKDSRIRPHLLNAGIKKPIFEYKNSLGK